MAEPTTATPTTADLLHVQAGGDVSDRGDGASPKKGTQQVGMKSDSEPVLEEGLDIITGHAGNMEQRWQKRCRAKGKLVYRCPFCFGQTRHSFRVKRACATHIDKTHANQVEVMKLEGKPAKMYGPQRFRISPPRTALDLMPPGQAERMAQGSETRQNLQTLRDQAEKASNAKGVTIEQILIMNDTDAKKAVQKLTPKQLDQACLQGRAMNKRVLLRAIVKRMKSLGMETPY